MTELGNRLKEARLDKGMSLDDLQDITKIQKRYLKGIEDGNYDMMPGPFYVRAFIKQYAEAVGLVPEELFEEFRSELPSAYEDIPEKLSRAQSRKQISRTNTKIFDMLPKVLLGVFVIVALFLFWYFYQQNAKEDVKDNADQNGIETTYEKSDELAKKQEEEVTPQEDEENESGEDQPVQEGEPEEENTLSQEITLVESQGKNSIYELKNADKFEIKVVSTGETWVNIQNGNGKSFFQGMLKVGGTESQTVDFSNETEAFIVVGKAPDTEIYVNDEKLEFATDAVTQNITIRYVQENQ